MKMISLILALFTFSSYAQTPRAVCATPMDCWQVEQAKKAEAIRVKKEQDEAAYRQQQLDIQAAQLREMQAQREVMENELAIQRAEREEQKQAEEAQQLEAQEKAEEQALQKEEAAQ